jgi:hypothetical protein
MPPLFWLRQASDQAACGLQSVRTPATHTSKVSQPLGFLQLLPRLFHSVSFLSPRFVVDPIVVFYGASRYNMYYCLSRCTAVRDSKTSMWDLQRLADFSNVKGPAQAIRFRKANPDFFPPHFWKETVPLGSDDPIPEGDPILGLYGTDVSGALAAMGLESRPESAPLWWWFKQRLQFAWQRRFPLEICINLIAIAVPPLGLLRVWPYQSALMFLGTEHWRARHCSLCGARFVSDKPARLFCSNDCSAEARRTSRARSWKKHGREWRARSGKKGLKRPRIKRLRSTAIRSREANKS